MVEIERVRPEKFYKNKARFDEIKKGILLFLEFIKKCNQKTIFNKLKDLEMIKVHKDGVISHVPVHPTDEEIIHCLRDLRSKGQIAYNKTHIEWIHPHFIKEERQFGTIQDSPNEIRIDLDLKGRSEGPKLLLFIGGFILLITLIFLFAPYAYILGKVLLSTITIIIFLFAFLAFRNTKYLVFNKKDRTFTVKHTIFPNGPPIPLDQIKKFYIWSVTVTAKFLIFGGSITGKESFLKLVHINGDERTICSTVDTSALKDLEYYLNNWSKQDGRDLPKPSQDNPLF